MACLALPLLILAVLPACCPQGGVPAAGPPCLPPTCLKIPAEAHGKEAKLLCASGEITVESAQYGENCADCTTCKTDKSTGGNALVTVAPLCDGKPECAYRVCASVDPATKCIEETIGPAATKANDAKNPGHGGDPAWGCAKEFEVRYSCGSEWGWWFILFSGLAAASYVGGFVAHAHKVQGKPLDVSALPHRDFWREVHSLVLDGAVFARQRATEVASGQKQTGGGETATLLAGGKKPSGGAMESTAVAHAAAEEEEDVPVAAAGSRSAAAAAAGGEGTESDGGSSGDDDLVE